jgi:ATP-dependent Lhr-like helicase
MSVGGASRPSVAFERLAPPIRRWLWQQGWRELRDIQERAIPPVLAGRDVVIASSTASGKTEAAFLPLLSRSVEPGGVQVLAISPLKALINDQDRRLAPLAATVGLPVTPWHGDVAASRKRRLRDAPAGILIITPESLEAMMVTRGSTVAGFFAGLDYVVVDELHSFIASERGRQLQSLLHRIELAIGRAVPRIGLSATLGDLGLAARFLRVDGLTRPEIVESTSARRDVEIQVRGYLESEAPEQRSVSEAMGHHLYEVTCRGTHIVFANRRQQVEEQVHELKRRAEAGNAQTSFWPHHGSLAKEIREEAELALRGDRPATVVATTTLELGIDVGSVDTIVQLGAPPSVSSMRQRLGRSGRRAGDASVLRIYVTEKPVTARTAPQDQLRETVVQSVAMVELLVQRYNETPKPGALHLSTLVQQVLSLIAQRGGVRADDAWRALCLTGPFSDVDASMFAKLLRDLAARDLIGQDHGGTLLLGLDGEHLVGRYDFYSAFVTSEEYRLVAGSRTLGTVPVTRPLGLGDLILFAGSRWRVLVVDDHQRIIELEPAPGGRAPGFDGAGVEVGDSVRSQMRTVLESAEVPRYLDAGGCELLQEARGAYRRLGLEKNPVLAWGGDVLCFPWLGDQVISTLALMLQREGLAAAGDGVALLVERVTLEDVDAALERVLSNPPVALDLVTHVQNKHVEKYHELLGADLLDADYASSRIDVAGALCAAALLRRA